MTLRLRESLAKLQEDEPAEVYLDRAIGLARQAARTQFPMLRIQVSENVLGPAHLRYGAALWVERGHGHTESWQKVTYTIFAGTYAEVLALFAAALDRNSA